MVLKYIITPIMGTIIGYGTNYIAVKMLFRPKNEVTIMGHKLPFTPGAIPKGKPRLAKAIGDVVGNTLITKDDIRQKLLAENTQTIVIEKITEILNSEIKTEVMSLSKTDEESYLSMKAKLCSSVTEQILISLNNIGVGRIIANECAKVVRERIQNTMFKMIFNDELIASLTRMVGEEVQKYIDRNGRTLIGGEIKKKVDGIEVRSVSDVLSSFNITTEKINESVTNMYRSTVDSALDKLFEKLDISKMIEDKINAMDIDELETLVLQVMKKELDTIVNLGAVIGLIMGLINMAINILF